MPWGAVDDWVHMAQTHRSESAPEMTIRTDADIETLRKQGDLTTAEETLIAECRAGEPTKLGEDVPDRPCDARTVRADLLRYLITGGCSKCPTQDKGVDLTGAYVTGILDLDFATAKGGTRLCKCQFSGQVRGTHTRFQFLNLAGSHFMLGIHAVDMTVTGGVFLAGVVTKGEVNFGGARVDGQLTCNNADFSKETGHAFIDFQTHASFTAQGIRISGDLIMESMKANGEFNVAHSHIGGQLSCANGCFESGNGSAFSAQGIEVFRGVHFRDIQSKGTVNFSSAIIGGQLDLSEAKISSSDSYALNGSGAQVSGSMYLRALVAHGGVSLAGARILGQLEFDGAKLSKARIEKEPEKDQHILHHNDLALNAQGLNSAVLIWRNVVDIKGAINLNGAKLGMLFDDTDSWELVERLYLNGFRYESISGPMTARMRMGWLSKDAATAGEFRPQPYEQLAHVFRSMGHEADRRAVLIKKETLQRADERQRLRAPLVFAGAVARFSKHATQENAHAISRYLQSARGLDSEFVRQLRNKYELLHRKWPKQGDGKTLPDRHFVAMAQAGFREEIFEHNARLGARIACNHVKDRSFRWLAGYGYQPFNFIWALILLLVIGWGMAAKTWYAGDFAPNSDVILSTREWRALAEGDVNNPAAAWSAKYGAGRDWETFHCLAYAFDVVVPIVTIGQTEAWAPSTNRGVWGWHLWWARWFLTVAGWVVTAVGAAAITGIIRRE